MGNHRLAAVKAYTRYYTKQLQLVLVKLVQAKEKKEKKSVSDKLEREIEGLEESKAELEAKLSVPSRWLVAVWDLGK